MSCISGLTYKHLQDRFRLDKRKLNDQNSHPFRHGSAMQDQVSRFLAM